jgi:hypothetical protein
MPTLRSALACLALCVSASALAAQYARARVWPPGFMTQIALDTIGLPNVIAGPAEKSYRATITAFDSLKIPLDTRDSLRGMVGNLALVRTRNLAGSQLSRWFNCGSGITGPNADSWRLYISIAALLDKVGADSTRIRIGMVAGAQDLQGNAKEPVPCATSGVLEARLLELIKARVSAP